MRAVVDGTAIGVSIEKPASVDPNRRFFWSVVKVHLTPFEGNF